MASEKDKTSSENAKSGEKSSAKPAAGFGARAKPEGSGAKGEAKSGASAGAKTGSAQASSGKPGSDQKSSAQPGAGQTSGAGKFEAGRSGSNQTGSGQAGAGQASRAGASGVAKTGKPLMIDLTAEKVQSKQAQDEPKAASKEAAGKSQSIASASETSKESGKETGTSVGSRSSAGGARFGSGASSSGSGGGGVGRVILAAGIGAVVAFGGLWGAERAGYVTFTGNQEIADLQRRLASTDGRFAALDERLRKISETDATPTVAPSVVNDMAARLQDLEDRLRAEAGLSGEVKSVFDGLDELRRFVSSSGAGSSAALVSLGDSVDKLKSEVDEIGGKVGKLEEDTSPVVRKALDNVDAKISALEGRTKAASEAASAAVKAASEGDAVAGNTLKAFSGRLDALSDSLDVTRKDLGAQEARLGTLEDAADSARKEIAAIHEEIAGLVKRVAAMEERMGGPGARETASRAIAVSLLKSAVDAGGRPYTSELAAVRSALPPETDFSALEANAGKGIETVTQLISSFPSVAAHMALTLERVDTGNSVADKFLNNMRSLVQVRATGDGAGSGPMGALGRMEENVRAGNLAQVLKIYDTLPDGTQNAGKDWAASARARLAADALVDKMTAEVIKALAKDS